MNDIGAATRRCLELAERGWWPELLDVLDQSPACARHVSASGETLLHAVVERDGATEVIQALIQLGADVNAESASGATPLGNAIRGGHRLGVDTDENLRCLIAAGADVSSFDETGNPPLHAAIYESRPKAVAQLLEAGADPMQTNAYGEDAYTFAARHGLSGMRALLP